LKEGHSADFYLRMGKFMKKPPKKTLRKPLKKTSAIILEMPEAPYTLNMKKVESVVINIMYGRPVLNRDALMNPQVLDYFEKIIPEIQKQP